MSAKGYWIGRVDVADEDAYRAYLTANGAAFARFGARFIVRGGEFEAATGEGLDLGAVLAFVQRENLPEPWLVGWSFGTDVILKFGNRDPVQGAILISPPLRFADEHDLASWADSGRSVLALVPEFDDYLRPDAARQAFATLPQARIVAGQGARHLWVGEAYSSFVLNEIVGEVAPVAYPLATDWNGPMQRWSDL